MITAMMLVRDRERFLADAIGSVLNQSLADFELLVVDDGSTDASPRIAREWQERDGRVRLIRTRHSVGIPSARNQALAQARGRFLAVCDSDDVSRPNRFRDQAELLAADPGLVGVAGSISCFLDDPEDGVVPQWHWGLRDGRPAFAFAAAMLRTGAVRSVGGFDRRFMVAEDVELSYRLAAAGYRLLRHDDVVVDYRIHGQNMSRSNRRLAWWTLRAQVRGVRLLRGGFSPRGYAAIAQSVGRLVRPVTGPGLPAGESGGAAASLAPNE